MPAHTPEEVEAALRDVGDRFWRRTLPATVVTRRGWAPWVFVHVPDGTGARLTIDLEDGGEWEVRRVHHLVEPRWVDGRLVGEAAFELPWNLPLGWHRMVAHVDAEPLDPTSTTATVVVTPHRLTLPQGLDERRAVGVATQLYQVRSAESWGIGDRRPGSAGHLGELAAWCRLRAREPAHAAEPVPRMEPSPYLPTSRRFLNPLYLRVEDVPEVRDLDPDDAAGARGAGGSRTGAQRRRPDRPRGSWELKRAALGLVHAVGCQRGPTPTGAPGRRRRGPRGLRHLVRARRGARASGRGVARPTCATRTARRSRVGGRNAPTTSIPLLAAVAALRAGA